MTLNFYIDRAAQIPDRWLEFILKEELLLVSKVPLEFFTLNKFGELVYVTTKGEIAVDLVSAYQRFYLQRGKVSPGPLYRALGLKNRVDVNVVDATGGTGKDSALLLSFGVVLTVFERNPILQVLWRSEVFRLQQKKTLPLSFIANDIQKQVFSELPQIIYFDPMYQQKDKNAKALSRQSMEVFEEIVGEDHDQKEVLQYLKTVATERVVVKRPVKGAPLLAPTMSYTGKTARYDVYVIKK